MTFKELAIPKHSYKVTLYSGEEYIVSFEKKLTAIDINKLKEGWLFVLQKEPLIARSGKQVNGITEIEFWNPNHTVETAKVHARSIENPWLRAVAIERCNKKSNITTEWLKKWLQAFMRDPSNFMGWWEATNFVEIYNSNNPQKPIIIKL